MEGRQMDGSSAVAWEDDTTWKPDILNINLTVSSTGGDSV